MKALAEIAETADAVATPARSQGLWRQILPRLLLALAGPLLMLILIEGYAFLWERSQANGIYAWEMVASRRIDLIPQPEAGYTLMKPGSHYEWQGIPVDINAHGLRGPEFTTEKPPGVFRILNLGDSIAMGWGVREEDTYGRQLENLLNASRPLDLRYEVINAGVPGWNPENELAYLQKEGLEFEPDLILLDLTIVNDIYGKNALAAQNRPPLIEFLRAHTYSWPFLSVQMQWMSARAEGKDRIDVIDPPRNPSAYFPQDPDAERWDLIWDRVLAMNKLASRQGISFAVILFPLEFQVVDPSFPIIPQQVLGGRAAAAGIATIDLLPAYQEACGNKPGGLCQIEDRYLFADVWMHPSPLGHELTAQAISDGLGESLTP